MAITSTYRLDGNDVLVETEGGMMDPVLSVIKSPVNLFSTEASDTYVTQRRAAVETLIGTVAGIGGALFYQAHRVKHGKQPMLANLA